MKSLRDVYDALPGLDESLRLACRWLTDVAQIKTDELPPGQYKQAWHQPSWKGAFFGEYRVAQRRWDFFCPTWHGGQAVKALALAHQVTGDAVLLDAARLGADFILNQRIAAGPDAGLILGYEDKPDKLNVSAILETLDGLFVLSRVTGDARYRQAALDNAVWCLEHAWVKGEGVVLDLYDPRARQFVEPAYTTLSRRGGRPLADDAVWFTCYQLTGDARFREAFYDVLECLLRTEHPPGNWVGYGPCLPATGEIHPRHAYWWGWPMLAAWRDSHEQRFLDAARRSAQWYVDAQRNDGGLFRYTDVHFRTACFGHATSGIVCAAILWIDLFRETGETRWLEPLHRALRYAQSLQFTRPADPNLAGCILEKVLPPDGTDASPYHIRDLATIFFVQAVAQLIASLDTPRV